MSTSARIVRILFCAVFFSGILAAQQPKILAPHKLTPPLVEHPKKWYTPAVLRSVVGGMWMTDANFKSTI